jgi:hypothetical protein
MLHLPSTECHILARPALCRNGHNRLLHATIKRSAVLQATITHIAVLQATIKHTAVLQATITHTAVLQTTITHTAVLQATITHIAVLQATITHTAVLHTTITAYWLHRIHQLWQLFFSSPVLSKFSLLTTTVLIKAKEPLPTTKMSLQQPISWGSVVA